MSISIRDFRRGDLSQYFAGTWVRFTTRQGNIRVGRIDDFTPNNRAIMRIGTATSAIPLENILWSGLHGTRCVAQGGMLMFISPAGARHHKKPPSHNNICAIGYQVDGGEYPHMYRAGSRYLSDEGLLSQYLHPAPYPEDTAEAYTLMERNRGVVALSADMGLSLIHI